MKLYLKLAILFLLFIASSADAGEPRYVRVAIIQDISSLRLNIKGFFKIIDPSSSKIIYRAKKINTTVTLYQNRIILGDIKSNSDRLFIKSDDPEVVLINGRPFRGNIQLIGKNAKLLVVNFIELEDYIKGILYHEASHYWPMEALKAQAVASRTYVSYQMNQNRAKDFDVTNDVYSQVYGGKASERYRTNKAVDETKSQVMFYDGKLIPAYFHATCAGHTEDAAILWNINIPPLKGVPCPFCKESPHFSWHYDLTLKEVEGKLSKAGFKIKDISSISVDGRDDSGRVINLKIASADKEIKIPAKAFRSLIGPDIIRSTNFNVAIVDKDLVFEGFGWGHGVGLCQWGAYFMAKKGYSFEKILKYYYPGIDVKTL